MREEAIYELKNFMKEKETYLAAWEGGSAASGFLDENSDLDLAIIVQDDYLETAMKELKMLIENRWGIDFYIRVPEPNWHGHSQFFCKPKSEYDFFYFDILIEKETCKGDRFTSSDRHGNSIIWFDHKNLVDTSPLPKESLKPKQEKMIMQIKELFPLLSLELRKSLARENKIESFETYFRLVRQYTILLNIRYRPAKYDFGMRYLDRDFPPNDAAFIKKLLYVENFEELKENAFLLLSLLKQEIR